MIFSYAFLPVSFILSMIPSFDGMSKRAITKLFNTILTRAGITLIITTAFSISTMLYTLSAGYPFFLIAFLQIVTFAGIYFKLFNEYVFYRSKVWEVDEKTSYAYARSHAPSTAET